jgi:hypothetical protein
MHAPCQTEMLNSGDFLSLCAVVPNSCLLTNHPRVPILFRPPFQKRRSRITHGNRVAATHIPHAHNACVRTCVHYYHMSACPLPTAHCCTLHGAGRYTRLADKDCESAACETIKRLDVCGSPPAYPLLPPCDVEKVCVRVHSNPPTARCEHTCASACFTSELSAITPSHAHDT